MIVMCIWGLPLENGTETSTCSKFYSLPVAWSQEGKEIKAYPFYETDALGWIPVYFCAQVKALLVMTYKAPSGQGLEFRKQRLLHYVPAQSLRS